jgi:ABC-type nitrate/sulfonate/bicarbonate transport system substrate-binding protein
MRLPSRRNLFLALLAVLAIGALLAVLRARLPAAPAPAAAHVRIAIPVQLAAGAMFVAEERALFARQAVRVDLQRFLLGKQALQAVIDGHADLALVADTPFMHAVLRGQQVAALATVFESRRTMALLARRDAGISGLATLKGKTVGTVTGTNAEFFLDTLFDVNDVARSEVEVEDLIPGQLVNALLEGKVDAVTVWHPDLARAELALGSRGLTLYGEDIFVYRFLLVGQKTYIAQHQDALRRVLAALKDSNDFINAEPAQARAMLSQAIGLPPAQLASTLTPSDYRLVLDQSLLIALSAQARWALANSGQKQAPPDYLDFIRPEPLQAVMPDAERIIR